MSDKTVVIIAKGANSLEIPCLIAPSVEAATSMLKTAGCIPLSTGEFLVPDKFRGYDEDGAEDEHTEFWAKFFTSVYEDAEPWCFVIREVPMLTPFIQWDLD